MKILRMLLSYAELHQVLQQNKDGTGNNTWIIMLLFWSRYINSVLNLLISIIVTVW